MGRGRGGHRAGLTDGRRRRRSRTGVQLKDKWRNLIKFQHLRKDEAAKVPYKAAVRARAGSGKSAGSGANVGGSAGRGGSASKSGAKSTAKGGVAGKGGAQAGKKSIGAGGSKKTTKVSRDALSKKGGNAGGAASTMSAKEMLKANFGRGHRDDDAEDDDDDGDVKTDVAVKYDPELDASLDTLKKKRAGMVNEVENAERELARMKTVVEEAEAVYSSARARVHEVLVGEHGKDDYEAEEGAGPEDETDWDKYLHFGEHETDDEEDEEVARAAEAAAEAHAAVVRATSAKKPSEKRPRVTGDEDEHATDQDDDSDREVEDPDDSDEEIDEDDEDLDEEERIARMANAVLAEAGLPPMHEIEHVLLTELKKLEAANAAVVHARLALEAVDAEFHEAVVNAHNAAARAQQAVAFDADEEAFGIDEDDELDDEQQDAKESRSAPTKSKAKQKIKSVTQTDGTDASGGRVVEDRRYGIYDARRYRSEAENDAEAAAAAKSTRVPSTTGKRKNPTMPTPTKGSKSAKKENDIWYELPKPAAMSATGHKEQQHTITTRKVGSDGLTWRRKRTATRVTIGRPVAGPTSWAAIGQHIIKE